MLYQVPLVGVQRHTTLGSIISPVFRPKPEDDWSPREIGLFESAMCNYGKNFNAIQRIVSTCSWHPGKKGFMDFFSTSCRIRQRRKLSSSTICGRKARTTEFGKSLTRSLSAQKATNILLDAITTRFTSCTKL